MTEIRNDTAAQRFELAGQGGTGILEYRREGDRLVLLHTEVPQALSGQGIGSRLVRGVLEQARAGGSRVVPQCSFVAEYIARHPEYRDLVAEG